MVFSAFLFSLWMLSGSAAELQLQIECTVMNLEYLNCTWDGDRTLVENITFKSSYGQPDAPSECSSYQYAGAVRVGCVVPYDELKIQRFSKFYAWIYRNNIVIAKQEYKTLLNRVKLDAPYNVSVFLRDPELWIYWNITNHAKLSCQEREVRYRVNSNKWITNSNCVENAFNVPFPNAQRQYEFQMRVRISSTCGQSEMWSEWSEPVFWGPMKEINDTETRQQTPAGLMVLCTVGAAVVLIMLTCLLIHSERLRVILVPVVPSPKNLKDLIDNCDGNVEDWLHISKELQDGFKPNFSERPCAVREFRTEAHSESESDDCLSVHTSVSSD
ncbi:interleukin 2 receptor, gamma a [Neoarius graeffei]|uniref:interleukin 2 receptor, gamma a n=1 Tax=Neoarius graeffei TaxID=443677 RepID=UPI00298CE664|nr:interleukin 2 receptor, gamma a [Neoarius graeffei]